MKAGIIFDLDKTLTTEDQQEVIFRDYGIKDWWSKLKGIDFGLSWMQQFILDIPEHFPGMNNEKLKEFGKKVPLEKGIPEWFDKIKIYAKNLGIELEIHIISLGNYHMIKGMGLLDHVDYIHAGIFKEENEKIVKIRNLVTPYEKIKKAKSVYKKNNHLIDLGLEDYHILPRNLIGIGDGESDADILRHIHSMGGRSIGVYKRGNEKAKEILENHLKNDVSLIAPRDYRENSELDKKIRYYLKQIIENKCDMDFDLVQRFKRNQIQNKNVKELAEDHLKNCKYCQERLEVEIL